MAIDRLNSGDRLMLRAGARWPQHIGALAILDGTSLFDPDGQLRIEAVRGAVQARLGGLPRFRQVLRMPRLGLGPPYWTDAAHVDLADHVRVAAVPDPGSEAQLLDVVERLRRRPLDLSRPPWEMWFLTGLPGRSVGMFVRIHHAAADGLAAMVAFSAFVDPPADEGIADSPTPARRPAAPWRPSPRPSSAALLIDNLRRRVDGVRAIARAVRRPRTTARAIADSMPALREVLAEEPATRTSLNRFVGPGRRIALVEIPVADVRRVGRFSHATPNDVLLALTAGGVRALLAGRGEPVEEITIRVYVPVSLRRGRAKRAARPNGNAVAQMAVPIGLAGDPIARLGRIAGETARRRRRRRTSLGLWFASGFVTRLLLRVISRQRVNVTTANLPGPRDPERLLGAPLRGVFPVVPLIGNVPLGIGAVSYAGTLDIGVTADRAAVPDLDVLVEGMRAELRALCASTAREPGDDDGVGVEPALGQGVGDEGRAWVPSRT